MLIKPRIRGILASLSVVAVLAVVPSSGVGAAPKPDPKAEASQACTALVSDLTGGLTDITTALTGAGGGGLLPLPDPNTLISTVTGLVGQVLKSAQSLISLGCLPDPLTALPVPTLKDKEQLPGVPLPGLPIPGLPPLPGGPGAPGTPAIPDAVACAAPAADLLSQLFGLISNLLKAVGLSLTDLLNVVTGLLGQVGKVQEVVTGLTGGEKPCLPLPAVPLKR